MLAQLKLEWNSLVSKFTNDLELTESLWDDLVKNYEQKSRAYHNLTHLNSMFQELENCKNQINDLEVLQFSIWFHDIVYQAVKKDNEEKSAEYAQKALQKIGLEKDRIERCFEQIILTKTHRLSNNAPDDDKFLIDFDLEVLSRNWAAYAVYCQQIRKEYWMFPSVLYKKGRRAAMEKFLEREWIYQTANYRKEKENLARTNIEREINEMLG